jgi:hypothetical protein
MLDWTIYDFRLNFFIYDVRLGVPNKEIYNV